jgi:hypothetical protein
MAISVILIAMRWIDLVDQVDQLVGRRSRQWSLNSTILYVVVSSVYVGLSIGQTLKYAKSGDSVGLFLGIGGFALGLLNALFGTAIIRKHAHHP